MIDDRGDRISEIAAIVDCGYVVVPDGVDALILGELQDWHDFHMEPSQVSRHDTFPLRDRVTNPLTMVSA